jgi:hypothetical protein
LAENDGDLGDEVARDAGTSLIGTGTRLCREPRECFTLQCQGHDGFMTSVCVTHCPTGIECEVGTTCINELDASCLRTCDSPGDCTDTFDCFDFHGEGNYVCIPPEWAARLASGNWR